MWGRTGSGRGLLICRSTQETEGGRAQPLDRLGALSLSNGQVCAPTQSAQRDNLQVPGFGFHVPGFRFRRPIRVHSRRFAGNCPILFSCFSCISWFKQRSFGCGSAALGFPLRFLCVAAVGHVVAPLQRGYKHRAGARCWRERDRPGTSASVRARRVSASRPSRYGRRDTSPASSRRCACRARRWRRRRSPSPGRPAALCPRSSLPSCLP